MFEDGTIFNELFIERLNYIIYVILLLIGLHGMIAKNNLIKKLIGMSIFQTAIILFYVSVGVKEGATIPIYLPEHDPHGSHVSSLDENSSSDESHGPVALEPELVKGYANPLPHVLMLTAIVVGVATLGLALALCQKIYQGYGTIEEDELMTKIELQETRSNSSGTSKQKVSPSKKKPESSVKATSKVAPKAAGQDGKKSAPQTKKTTSKKASTSKPKPKIASKSVSGGTEKKASQSKKAPSRAKKPPSSTRKTPPKK